MSYFEKSERNKIDMERKVEKKGRFTIIDLPSSPQFGALSDEASSSAPRSASSSESCISPTEYNGTHETCSSPHSRERRRNKSAHQYAKKTTSFFHRQHGKKGNTYFKKVEKKGRFTITEHASGTRPLSPKHEEWDSLVVKKNWMTAKATAATLRPAGFREKELKEKELHSLENNTTIGDRIVAKETGVPTLVSLPLGRENKETEEKKTSSSIKNHLASQQTHVQVSMDQVVDETERLTALLAEQWTLQNTLQSVHLQTSSMMESNSEYKEDTSDLQDLYTMVENVVQENKGLSQTLKKTEGELALSREENENLTTVASELRAKCLRLERKLQEEKATVLALSAEKVVVVETGVDG